jgi:hypothetical protein
LITRPTGTTSIIASEEAQSTGGREIIRIKEAKLDFYIRSFESLKYNLPSSISETTLLCTENKALYGTLCTFRMSLESLKRFFCRARKWYIRASNNALVFLL